MIIQVRACEQCKKIIEVGRRFYMVRLEVHPMQNEKPSSDLWHSLPSPNHDGVEVCSRGCAMAYVQDVLNVQTSELASAQ